MTNRKIVFASAIVAASMAAPVLADTAGELEALKARLAQLESQQSKVDAALAQSAAVDAAIADANKQQFLMLDGMSGYDGGFKISSADGNYVLQPYGEFQFRNVTNMTGGDDDAFNTSDEVEDSITNGFEVRRMKLGFKGNAVDKKLKYNFRFAFDRDGGAAELDYAYLTYELNDQLAIKGGQFKGNVFHEETTAYTRQLTAERSLLNALLGGGELSYVQGVALEFGSDDSSVHGEIAYIDGESSANTDYTESDDGENFGLLGRVDIKFSGNWKNYGDQTARGTEEDLAVLGFGGSWDQSGDVDTYRLTSDFQWENSGGLGAYAALIWVHTDFNGFETDDVGGLAQVGYLLPDANDIEIFGRGSLVVTDAETNGEDKFWEITVGMNKYFSGHNAKFTLDAGWLPNGSPSGESGLGVTDSTEDQLYVRAQMQLVL